MIIPPFLTKGDTVVVIAPARKVNRRDIEPQIAIIESWGLKVLFSEYLFREFYQFSGTEEERVKDFNNAINNPEIKAILCARGGYGTVRIIDEIGLGNLKDHPKWIIGFSDITVIHNELNNLRVASIHGPMPLVFPKTDTICLEYLRQTLFGEHLDIIFPNSPRNKKGRTTGELVGGNLSILVSMIGTKSDIDTVDKILFIEDLDEYYYHIDRMLHQLKRAGKLSKLKGLIVGSMNDMKDNTIPFGISISDMVLDLVKGYNYPVVFDFPIGHESMNHSLIVGGQYDFSVGERCCLRYCK